MKLNIDKLNFDKCEDEPIHIPEAIQGYGYLFALDPKDHTIVIHSRNVTSLLKEPADLLGRNFFDFVNSDKMDLDFFVQTYERAKDKDTRLPVRLKLKKKLLKTSEGEEFYSVIYASGGYFVVELEPAGRFRQTYSARHYMKLYALRIAPKFKTFESLEQIAQEIVTTIKTITQMERVVIYRFNPDASGKVIAEAKNEQLESYLNLNYPSSDIPKQARELYLKNWVRLIPNVDLEPSDLVPSVEESGREPLDMTYSILRNLSPIHRQYVRNQGLKASMSMSLVTHNKLWGIISCHATKPTYVPQNVRLECENLSQLFSWHLYAKEEELYIEKRKNVDAKIEDLLNKEKYEKNIVQIFNKNIKEVLSIVEADGFIFFTEDETVSIGNTPSLEVVNKLVENLDFSQKSTYATNNLKEKLQQFDSNGSCGMLVLPLLHERGYFTAWFRNEHVEVQRWAGKPNEKSINASKKERLTPRTSFTVHEERVTGRSKIWTQQDKEIAERFNKIFMI
jgi:light-regulated signal transduction histidine kinase (bacteriophytochrome)